MTQLELPLFDIEMTESQLMLATGVSRLYQAVNYDQFYVIYWRRIYSLMKSRNWTAIVVTVCETLEGPLKYRYTFNEAKRTGISRYRVV